MASGSKLQECGAEVGVLLSIVGDDPLQVTVLVNAVMTKTIHVVQLGDNVSLYKSVQCKRGDERYVWYNKNTA